MTRQAIEATNKNKAIGSGIPRPEIDWTTNEKFIIFGGTETIKTADKQILAMKSINLRHFVEAFPWLVTLPIVNH